MELPILSKKNKLNATIYLGKYYKLKLKKYLAHEFGHMCFRADHPLLHSMLYLISLPYSFPDRLKRGKRMIVDALYSSVAAFLSLYFFPYGTVAFLPYITYYLDEYLADRTKKRRIVTVIFANMF